MTQAHSGLLRIKSLRNNYLSLKIAAVLLIMFLSINSYAQMGGNNPRVFNVKLFGASGDSTQDATPGIQAAINACFAAGGGTVFFPNGNYFLNSALVTSENGVNPNSQLYISPMAFDNVARSHILFKGETRPNYTPAILYADGPNPNSGVIIKSTITGSGVTPAVFGGVGISSDFNYEYVSFEDLTILVKSNRTGTGPTMSGINAGLYPALKVRDCVVGIDCSLFIDTTAQNEVAAIICPRGGSETSSEIRSTLAFGMRYGFFVGEHTILDNAQAFGNYAGFVFQRSGSIGGHPISAYKILSQWNSIDILIPDNTLFGVAAGLVSFNVNLLAVETYNQNARWFNNVYTVKDSLNYGLGKVENYKIGTTGGVVGNVSFLQYNGTGIQSILYNDKIVTTTRATGITELSETNPILRLTSAVLGSPRIQFNKGSTTKWVTGVDLLANGTSNYHIYDNSGAGKARLYADSLGNFNIGGTASEASTSAIAINTLNSVSFDNNAFYFNASLHTLGIGAGTSPTYPLTVITPSSIAGYIQGTTASSQAAFYLENNRGSFASYGGWIYGGSTIATSLFGATRADKLFIIADGANNLGFYTGTLSAQPYIIGTNNTERARFISGGQFGLGLTVPTALLHIKAGTTAASSAPLKFTSGTNLTTPEAGAVEFDGTNYFATSSTTRYTLAKTLTNTATLDFDLTALNYQDLTITVTGAVDGDAIVVGAPNGSVVADVTYFGWVSGTNTVTIRCSRVGGGGAADPASGTFRASVTKY